MVSRAYLLYEATKIPKYPQQSDLFYRYDMDLYLVNDCRTRYTVQKPLWVYFYGSATATIKLWLQKQKNFCELKSDEALPSVFGTVSVSLKTLCTYSSHIYFLTFFKLFFFVMFILFE